MRKFTKLMLTLTLLVVGVGGVNATKKYAAYSTPDSKGSWNAETSTYSWTESYSNLMTIFECPNGELADYKALHLKTSGYTDGQQYRVCFMNGGTAVATIAFYSGGQKDLVFSERTETKDVDLSKITHISFGGASGSGSIKLDATPYLEKPMTLTFDNAGNAVVDITDLTASGCLSLNDETGVLTSTLGEEGAPTWGRLAINFPEGGTDLSAITGFSMSQTGTVLFNNFEIGGKGFWSNVTGRSDLASYITDAAVGDPTHVTTWRWNVSSAGTMTITKLTLQFSAILANNPHYTDLTTTLFNSAYCEYHVGEAMGQGTTIYGNGNVVTDMYADLSGYDALHITGTPGKGVRLLFNWGTTKNEVLQSLNSEGFTSIDLTALPAQQLNAFKFPWDGQTGTITSIKLYKASVSSPYDYVMTGSGVLSTSAASALSDASATIIDATGITKATALTTANKNCLITASAGMVTNPGNVIVGGTCASLTLADGAYNFRAPADFTATSVSYDRSFTAGSTATVCLPFALTADEVTAAGDFYQLSGVSGSTLTFDKVTTTEANKPYLFVAKTTGTITIGGGKSVVAASTFETAVSGASLIGTMTAQTLKSDGSQMLYGYQGGQFVRVGSDKGAKINPFRAYIAVPGSSLAPSFSIELNDADVTAIKTVAPQDQPQFGNCYDLSGRRMTNSPDAPTAKGLYIVNGKKYIVK